VELRDQTWGVFQDPFFLSEPIDLSTPIFLIMYGSIAFFIFYHLNDPKKIINIMQAATVLLIIRTLVLFIFRFDEPVDMINLKDPIMETFVYSQNPETGQYNRHDLFFSGHTANLFLLAIYFNKKRLKIFFIILAVIMAICLVLQQAHYSIDVISAPIFSLIAFFAIKKIKQIYRS
tara:strand:+ start:638 stop:1165 length:528 start_codon:yes stop_codon:yes gene_type:complete